MRRLYRLTATALSTTVVSLLIVACNRGDKPAGGDKSADGKKSSGGAQSASVPKVQTNRAPCDWISRADAEKTLGELTAELAFRRVPAGPPIGMPVPAPARQLQKLA